MTNPYLMRKISSIVNGTTLERSLGTTVTIRRKKDFLLRFRAFAKPALGLIVGLLTFFFPGGTVWVYGQTPVSIVGLKAPSFDLTDLTGETHAISWPLPEKQILLLWFYEPRSSASILEMTWLDKMQSYSKDRGLTILAVEASGLSSVDAKAALDRYQQIYPGPMYPLCSDPEYKLSRLFHVKGVPTTVLIGSDGTILYVLDDFTHASKSLLAKKISEAILLRDGLPLTSSGTESAPPLEVESETETSARTPAITANEETVQLGSRLPQIELVDLKGRKYKLGASKTGARATVVFFWGAVCLPCFLEMTYFNQVYRELKESGLLVIGVQASGLDAQGTQGALKRYQRLYAEPSYPIVLDTDFAIGKLFGVAKGGPATFIADSDGVVIYYHDKFLEGQESTVTAIVADSLKIDAQALNRRIRREEMSTAAPGDKEAESVILRMEQEKKENNLNWGNRYYKDHNYDLALGYYLDYLKEVSDDIEIISRVAEIYERQEKFDLALSQWNLVLRLQPGNDIAILRSKSLIRRRRSESK